MRYSAATITLICMAFFISCTKPYTIDLNDIEKRVVIHSFLCPDSLFMANLTEEASLTDNVRPPYYVKTIDNAQIVIYGDNAAIDTLDYTDKGIYVGHFKPNINSMYKINVKATGYDEGTAESKIPTLVRIDSVGKKKIADDYSDNLYELTIYFTDPPNEKNFYYIAVSGLTYDLTSNDPVFGGMDLKGFQEAVFNDNLFDGNKYAITIEVRAEICDWYPPDWNFIAVNLQTISKDFYLYAASYNKQMPEFGDDMMALLQQGLIEPLPIYSNISGGLGLFAGYTNSQDSVFFERNTK